MPLSDFITDLLSPGRGHAEYAEKLSLFLSDKKLTDAEEKALDAIAVRYGLSTEQLTKLQAAAIGEMYLSMAKDERITEDERKALHALVKHFGVSLEKTAFNQKQFLKFYTLALIENGMLPELTKRQEAVPIVFQDDEILHWVCPARLKKHQPGKSGARITKEKPYKVGSGSKNSEFVTEDTGTFYMTNDRLGFLGPKKQFSVKYTEIHAASVGPGGLSIYRKGRASPLVVALDDYDVAGSILSFIVNR